MGEDEKNRLVAWNREPAAAHQRLRQALRVTRDALDAGDAGSAGADLVLYCHGFCAALREVRRSLFLPVRLRRMWEERYPT